MISHTAPPRAVGVVGWIFTLGGGTALLGGATGLVAGLVMAVVLPGAHAPVAKQTLVAICLWNGGLAALGAIVTRAGILFLELDEQGRRLLEGVAWFGLSVTTTVAALALAGLIGRFHPSTVLSRTVAAGRWWLICGGPCALALWYLRSPRSRVWLRALLCQSSREQITGYSPRFPSLLGRSWLWGIERAVQQNPRCPETHLAPRTLLQPPSWYSRPSLELLCWEGPRMGEDAEPGCR